MAQCGDKYSLCLDFMSPLYVQSHWLGSEHLLGSQEDQEDQNLESHFQGAVRGLPGRVSMN